MENQQKDELLSVFRKEAEMHIQELNKGLLALENDPSDKTALKDIRRRAHTLKGSARMMEFMEISSMAHTMEGLLESAVENPSGLESGVFDELFQCLDSISDLIQGGNGDKAVKESEEEIEADVVHSESPPEDKNEGIYEEKAVDCYEPAETYKSGKKVRNAILVRTDKLDSLANVIGELILDQMRYEKQMADFSRMANMLQEQVALWPQVKGELYSSTDVMVAEMGESETKYADRYNNISLSLLDDMENLLDEYRSATTHRKLVMNRLDDDIRSIRLVPMSTVFDTFPRVVRDLGKEYGKEIAIDISGGEVELDKSIIDTIKDPLVHLVRNAVDHGIETPEERLAKKKPRAGRIALSAYRHGSEVVIEVADDGAGMDLGRVKQVAFKKGLIEESQIDTMDDESALQLIFTSGLSTSPIITDVSGRGVGMDVVMENISRKLKGAVNIESEFGMGTKVSLTVPVTLTIMRGLLVSVGQETFAIPTRSIEKNIKISMRDVKSLEGKQVILDDERIIPLTWLGDILGIEQTPMEDEDEPLSVVIIDHAQKQIGLCVDSFGSEQEMVVKSMGSYLKGVPNVAGVTVMTDGRIISILHVSDLVISARDSISSASPASKTEIKRVSAEKPSILVVDDSLTTRELERSILEASGYDVYVAVDGLDGLNKVSQRKFDLIISDVQMPRLDGFNMVAKLKQDPQYSDIPVIMVTSLQKDEEKRRGIAVGASAYIVKSSFDQSNLLETIHTLIGQ